MEVLTSILQHNRVEGQHWRAGVLGRTDRSKWPGQQASNVLARSLALTDVSTTVVSISRGP